MVLLWFKYEHNMTRWMVVASVISFVAAEFQLSCL